MPAIGRAGMADAEFVTRYAAALRRRAALLLLARAGCAAVGTGAVALALAALSAGPVATPTFARTAFAVVAVAATLALIALLQPLRGLGGTGVCRLLQPVAPDLASRLRSALELGGEREATVSAALVAAHARDVASALARVPRSRVAGWRWLRHRAVWFGLAAAVVGAATLTSGRAAPGLRALLHPATVMADGLRIARVVSHVHARLVFPAYLDRAPTELDDWTELSAPRGTSVELRVVPRIPSQGGLLRVGATDLRLTPAHGALAANFVVREDASIELRVQSDGQWYADDHARRVHAITDAAPTISLSSPEGDMRLRRDDPVMIRFHASDDIGLSGVDLVTRIGGGQESRRRLWSSLSETSPRKELDQDFPTTPAEQGAHDGDTLLLWLETQDGDVVSGPKRAVSRTVTLEITPRDQRAALEAPRLRALLDEGIGILGDRLETPVPDATDAATRRFDALRTETEPWLAGIEAFAAERKELHERDRVRGIAVRTRRLLDREAHAVRGGGGHEQNVEADARVVEEHERDVLLLADLLGESLVDEARDLTSDLAQAAAEMRQLLDQLRTAPNEEAKRALLAEIANAERRLMDLARNLSQMATRVPSEFVNREAMSREDSRGALDSLRDAVQAGDMEAALKHLDELAKQFDKLAQQIENGGGRYRESRFGPEDAALAQARQGLNSLAAAQEQLAQRSNDLVRKLSDRAGAKGGTSAEQLRNLQAQAEAIERDLQRVPKGALGGLHDGQTLDETVRALSDHDAQTLKEARQRARDTSDALRTGDLSEAKRNAARTGASLEQLAPDLRNEASMFPGHKGETAQASQAVDSALSKLGDLQRQLDDAAPKLDPLAGEGERSQMRGDAKQQGDLQSMAESLEQAFDGKPGGQQSGQTGGQPSGQPGEQPGGQSGGQSLSPSAANEMRQARQRMQQAREALEQGRAEDASLAQEDASRRLRELGKQLDGKGQKQGGGAQPSEGMSKQEGGDGGHVEGPVHIPSADEFHGPERLRRRLLDAMREPSPPGFEQAVGRYYEELLR